MKKLLNVLCLFVLAFVSFFTLASCDNGDEVKVGLICLHDENSTYDKNFIDAFKAACEAKGATPVIKTGIDESQNCYDAAVDLVDTGCKFVFADSFGHESYLLKAAKNNPDVQFYHATGTTAHTENVANFHNAFASIYEGRYLAGVAAGLKLQAMNVEKPVVGYVGAFTYAEVVSGYTAFYLGVKSICPTVTMKVQFTGSWYDEVAERTAAKTLINAGCNLISQHADSMGAPTACEQAGVPNVSYNGSTAASCPNTFIVSSKINWQPYFELCIDAANGGKEVPTDFVGTIADGSVQLTALGTAAAEGTQAKLDEAKAKLENGSLKVFDCSTFTVNGEHLTTSMADVDTDAAFTADTEAIKTDGSTTYFAESEFRSAPYFALTIDGIELLNQKF